MLTLSHLNKTYSNGVQALKDVSLNIPKGMFGLLGPNGAGKSSLMRTIATLQTADSGEIMLGDLNLLTHKEQVRQMLGYLPQEFGVYPRISAQDLLSHFAVLKGITHKNDRKAIVSDLLQQTNLYDSRHKPVYNYSGGMKQRFGIAQALLGDPQLIIVDEPTAGLDPAERNRFHNLLAEIGENRVVILSTHIVEDVSDLCTQMAILASGKILLRGDPLEVIEALKGKVWGKVVSKAEFVECQQAFDVISHRLSGGRHVVHILADTSPGSNFEAVQPNLEDAYFSTLFKHNALA